MSAADFTKRGPVQSQIVRIMEVVPSDRRVTGVLKDGGRVDIAVWGTDSSFTWPKVMEIWRVIYDQGYWKLDSRLEYGGTANNVAIEDMNPGETRIAGDTIHTDGPLNVNGDIAGATATFTGPVTTPSATISGAATVGSITVGGHSVGRKFVGTFTGHSPYTITHNLNTQDIVVSLYGATGSNVLAYTVTDANNIQITYKDNSGVATTISSGKVVIFG